MIYNDQIMYKRNIYTFIIMSIYIYDSVVYSLTNNHFICSCIHSFINSKSSCSNNSNS